MTTRTPVEPLTPLQLVGSCAVGYTVPATVKLWHDLQAAPGLMVGPLPLRQVVLLVHTTAVVPPLPVALIPPRPALPATPLLVPPPLGPLLPEPPLAGPGPLLPEPPLLVPPMPEPVEPTPTLEAPELPGPLALLKVPPMPLGLPPTLPKLPATLVPGLPATVLAVPAVSLALPPEADPPPTMFAEPALPSGPSASALSPGSTTPTHAEISAAAEQAKAKY